MHVCKRAVGPRCGHGRGVCRWQRAAPTAVARSTISASNPAPVEWGSRPTPPAWPWGGRWRGKRGRGGEAESRPRCRGDPWTPHCVDVSNFSLQWAAPHAIQTTCRSGLASRRFRWGGLRITTKAVAEAAVRGPGEPVPDREAPPVPWPLCGPFSVHGPQPAAPRWGRGARPGTPARPCATPLPPAPRRRPKVVAPLTPGASPGSAMARPR